MHRVSHALRAARRAGRRRVWPASSALLSSSPLASSLASFPIPNARSTSFAQSSRLSSIANGPPHSRCSGHFALRGSYSFSFSSNKRLARRHSHLAWAANASTNRSHSAPTAAANISSWTRSPRFSAIRNSASTSHPDETRNDHGLHRPPTAALMARGQPISSSLQSALLFRSFAIGILSSLVAYGAWFAARRDENSSSPESTASRYTSILQATTSPMGASLPFTSGGSSKSFSEPGSMHDKSSAGADGDIAGSTGRTFAVDDNSLYTGQIVGDGPLSKDGGGSRRQVLEMLTPEQATQRLRQNEQSYLVGRGQGVTRYDVVSLPSNNPIEDDHVERIVEVSKMAGAPAADSSVKPDWMFWGVFDGHSGWTTSAKLRQVLVNFVARELNAAHESALASSAAGLPSPEAIDAAIKKGFVRLDNEICHESVQLASQAKSKRAAVELLAPAYSGSCALLSFYDTRSKLLRVACTGDSRAVLGRRNASSGKWTATPLSEDQTGGTPSEDQRLRQEHPNEEFVTHRGRILGQLEPSRAFGDAIYKWSRQTAEKLKASFFGRSPSHLLKTPPYVTAEPIVTTTAIEPVNGDFVVMATDGLWECLTNEEVVGLVGQWLEQQQRGTVSSKGSQGGGISSWFIKKPALPVEDAAAAGASGSGEGQRAPVRQDQWQLPADDNRFVVEDRNAATHLVRNALGGKDRDMVCALLSLPTPYSRRYRDDITVEVIFFGPDPATGDVEPNWEATAPTPIKAKL